MMKRVERIEVALSEALALTHLEVLDESSGHNVPEGAESHFKVVAVSESFVGHQCLWVNELRWPLVPWSLPEMISRFC